VARAGVALTDRHPRAARGVGPRGARRALREEALAGVAMPVERLVPAFAADAAVVRTRDAIVTRARHARACAARAPIADGAAGPPLAGLAPSAGIVVVARAAVRLVRVPAHARGRVAHPRHVTLVERRAGDGRGRAPAGPALAGLARGAGVVVVARGAVRLVRVRAHAGGRVTRARHVALVEGRAGEGRGRALSAPVLSRLGRGAGVVVVRRAAVLLVRVRAHARVVARPRHVTLVERRAGDGRGRAPAGP